MLRKALLVISVLFLASALLLAGASFGQARAVISSDRLTSRSMVVERDKENPSPSLQEAPNFLPAVEIVGADPADFRSPTGGSGDDQETILQVIQTLVAQWSGAVLQKGDWLHMVTHHMRDKDRASSLPGGEAIPLNYISETWYHLDDRGRAVEVIAFMRSEDGETVQVSTFRDNIWQNLTVGEKWGGEPFTPCLDLGFSTDAAQSYKQGSTLGQQRVTLAGRTALRFTIRDEFDSPLLIEGYAQPVIRAERRAYLDMHNGAPLLLERVLVAADGKERIVEQVWPVTVECGVEPPAEVLAFLQQEMTE